jgi:hypothetical protein
MDAGRLPIVQTGSVGKADNTNKVEAKPAAANTSEVKKPELDLKNKVDINFNVSKAPTTGLANVNIFEKGESLGKAAMKTVADSVGDIDKGAKMIEASKIYQAAMSLFV